MEISKAITARYAVRVAVLFQDRATFRAGRNTWTEVTVRLDADSADDAIRVAEATVRRKCGLTGQITGPVLWEGLSPVAVTTLGFSDLQPLREQQQD
jgi:hypothetical protein